MRHARPVTLPVLIILCCGVLVASSFILSLPVFAETIAEALWSFGLEGRWSLDCAKEIDPRFNIIFTHVYTFSAAGSDGPSIAFSAGSLKELWKIESAQRVTTEKIKIIRTRFERRVRDDLVPAQPTTQVMVLSKKETKIEITDLYLADDSVIYRKGGFIYDANGTKNDRPAPLLEKCLN